MQPQLGIWKRLIKNYLGWTDEVSGGDMEEVYYKLISGGQMKPQLGIWKRFIRTLSGVDRCSLCWGSERGLLEVYLGWTDEASAGYLEEVY